MTKQTEALKLALEALETDWGTVKAITAIKEALAQPEQEPYCFTIEQKNGLSQGAMCRTIEECEQHPLYDKELDHIIPLFKQYPQPKEPEQEPVAWIEGDEPILTWVKTDADAIPLYTTPPQRKPLTRGQIREIEVDVSLNPSFDYITPAEQLCRAIEAAHGIKGEA